MISYIWEITVNDDSVDWKLIANNGDKTLSNSSTIVVDPVLIDMSAIKQYNHEELVNWVERNLNIDAVKQNLESLLIVD